VIITSNVRQSKYGYWIVDVSVAPAQTMSIMICKLGITPDEARQLALAGVPGTTGKVSP
jgi:hypothetical protein